MIVDPDFFDHWRTRMVVDMLGGDALAPVYIMRLWAHCQNRKSDTFAIPPSGIKALCHFTGDAQVLEDALIAAEYLVRDGQQVTVVGWAQKNAQLIAAWENGARGGRPKKEPSANREEAQWAPGENPRETHGKPTGNPLAAEKKPIREDKRREEEPPLTPPAGGFEEFWQAYPRKVGKDAARKAFERRKPDTELLSQMLAAIRAQAASEQWRKDGGQFIPYPATWLNEGRWQDVVPAIAAGSTPGPKRGTDEYAALHKSASWWREAGFASVWDADASKCWHDNAHEFRDGKRVGVAA